MASASLVIPFLIISVLVISTTSTPLYCMNFCERELNLSLYLHQIVSGPNHNQEVILNPGFPNTFGVLAVNDWAVVDAPQANANVVAHAKGMHIQSSQQTGFFYYFLPFSMVFQDPVFNGSTLQVMGAISSQPTGELAIVGGTGKLSMARGTIKFKVAVVVNSVENYRQLDIHAIYTDPTL